MIDFFSRAGLFIVGIKVHRMSVADASDFYGPVREVLRARLKSVIATKTSALVEKEFGFKGPSKDEQQLGEILGRLFGDYQFETIVKFMSAGCPANASRRSSTSRAPRNASRLYMKASKPYAKSATCWGRPIPPRRRLARSAENSDR